MLLPAICAATLILIAAVQPWITLTQAFRDVQAVVYKIENRDLIPLAGFLSNFGIMAWVATFAISGFSALMIRSKRQTVLLGSLSILTLVLALDDFFIIHERVGPKNLGIPEKLFFLTYGLSAIAIVIAFFKDIRDMAGDLLLIAFICFFTSVTVDAFYILDGVPHRLLEDGAKLVGIAYWCAFCSRLAWCSLEADRR
ncbi:hypothetical protein [uncultured Roseovarius sp.]|uniref:hypothetical protein n=1 Tax=uncultured Roseovarius sp. TaxID=293344 RepID=UPI0026249B0E|nr:hypothetical protein [uncultured Roseovarius sp.]